MANEDTTPTNQTAGDSNLESADQSEDSLESTPANTGSSATELTDKPDESVAKADPNDAPAPSKKTLGSKWRYLFERFNIYLMLFILLIIIASIIVLLAYTKSKQSSTTANLSSKGLSASALAQLANTDSTVGTSGQILNVQSSAIFAGHVLVRQNLDVAGNLQLGGTLSINNLAVSGTTQLAGAQVNKDLQVAGNTSLQGSVSIAKSLQVNGGGAFTGPVSAPQLTTSLLQLNGDLVLTRHITTTGGTPSRTAGSAIGSGGTSSVSGNDTAGTIVINTGSNPSAGCLVTINFTSKYTNTPHILVTPVGSSSGGLSYYIDRSTSNFSVCDATPPPGGSSFGFDYFVID